MVDEVLDLRGVFEVLEDRLRVLHGKGYRVERVQTTLIFERADGRRAFLLHADPDPEQNRRMQELVTAIWTKETKETT